MCVDLCRFLWVYFQIEEICRQSCDDEIREVIQDLPEDLTQTYMRILSRISAGKRQILAKKVYKLIAAAVRPLSLPELHEALAIEPFTTTFQPGRIINDITRVLSWCGGFIVLEEINDEVHFAHPTMKSLLSSPPTSCDQDWLVYFQNIRCKQRSWHNMCDISELQRFQE